MSSFAEGGAKNLSSPKSQIPAPIQQIRVPIHPSQLGILIKDRKSPGDYYEGFSF